MISSVVSAVIFMAVVIITFAGMLRPKKGASLRIYIGCWCILGVGMCMIDRAPIVTFLLCSGEVTLLAHLGHYLGWTKDKNSDIIEEKEESVQCQSETQSGVPVGYDDWTASEKALYAIESRLTKGKAPEEDGESCKEEAVDDIAPKACVNCGCIVGNDACFCSQCGEKLNVPDCAEFSKEGSARVPKANETKPSPRHMYRPNEEIGSLIQEASTLNGEDDLF